MACALIVCSGQQVRAETTCKPVPDLSAAIEKFLRQMEIAQRAGGNLPIRDVLIGVTGIAPADAQALAMRTLVTIRPVVNGVGQFANSGPEIAIEGSFAARQTFFELPPLVRGQYRLLPDGVEFTYDPGYAIHAGESVLGYKLYKTISKTAVTRTGLLFYFDNNAGPSPDRCYTAGS